MSYFSRERFNDLWFRCTVIIDTSVFILLAQSNPSQSKRIMDIFNYISDSIWVPSQVKKEVDALLNNPRINDGVMSRLEKFDQSISQQLEKIKPGFSKISREMAVEGHEDLSEIFNPDLLVNKILLEFQEKKKQISKEYLDFKSQGFLPTFYGEVMKNVGHAFTDEEIIEIKKDGIERYNKNPPIPPGYCDKEKRDNRFGDLIVWKEVLRKMDQDPGEYIFITADKKEDWFVTDGSGNVISPHLKLIEESKSVNPKSSLDIVYFLDYIQASNDHFFRDYSELISYLEQYSFIHNKITEFIENGLFDLIEEDLQIAAADYNGYVSPDMSEVITIYDAAYDNDRYVHYISYVVEAVCYFDYVFDIGDRYDEPGDPIEMTSSETANVVLTVMIPLEGSEGRYDPNHIIVDTENWNFEIDSLAIDIKEPFEDDHFEIEDEEFEGDDPIEDPEEELY